jgi:MFS family permease
MWCLREIGAVRPARVDWAGNAAFAAGIGLILAAITYGIQPYSGQVTGWANPLVLGGEALGIALLVVFCVLESRVAEPMFRLTLFRVREFWAGNLAALLTAIARGGLQFMLIIWLQGIWLPLHGYAYENTPLWAGIYMLPLTIGFLVAGPISGHLSDRFGARFFATGGLLVFAGSFVGLLMLQVDFSYPIFATLLVVSGIGQGMFSSPNTSAIMGSVPAEERGVASGMRATVQYSGTALSIGISFSLMIAGLATALPGSLSTGLQAHGVPQPVAASIAELPPSSTLFAAFLGYNPLVYLLEPSGVLNRLPSAEVDLVTGQEFFPQLISGPFHHGLMIVFLVSAVMAVVGVAASVVRGGCDDDEQPPATPTMATASRSGAESLARET